MKLTIVAALVPILLISKVTSKSLLVENEFRKYYCLFLISRKKENQKVFLRNLAPEEPEPPKVKIPIIRLVSNHGDFLTTDEEGRIYASDDISRRNQWKVHLYENSLKFWLQNIFSEKFLHQSEDQRLTTWHGGLGNIWEVIGGDLKEGERVQLKSFYGHLLHRSPNGGKRNNVV